MLVLSRKVGERIHIGDNVVIEIRKVQGSRVSIAIDAPRGQKIMRGEIYEPSITVSTLGIDVPQLKDLGREAI